MGKLATIGAGVARFLGFTDKRSDEAYAIYNAVVSQSRQPVFYQSMQVPDSLDGRFDMIVLHCWLVLRRLKDAGPAGNERGQEVFDLFFDDMDQSLRELGVGDLVVGKRVKKMASAFYGRIKAYDDALASGSGDDLALAINRNVFPDCAEVQEGARSLADYVARQSAALGTQDAADILAGKVQWAAAPTVAA